MSRDDLADFAAPKHEGAGSAVPWLLAHGLAWGACLGLLAFAVPRFAAVFADFGVPLPRLSVLVIRAARPLTALRPVLLPALGALLAADWFLLTSLRSRGEDGAARSWALLALLVPLLLFVLMLVAMFQPLHTIMHRLSG